MNEKFQKVYRAEISHGGLNQLEVIEGKDLEAVFKKVLHQASGPGTRHGSSSWCRKA